MVKLVLVIVAVLFQAGICYVRDQRDVPIKVDHCNKTLAATIEEIANIDSSNLQEIEEVQILAKDYVVDEAECYRLAKRALANNLRKNELGNRINGKLQSGADYFKWINQTLQNEPSKIQGNLKAALVQFQPFVAAAGLSISKLKEFTINTETANNFMLEAVDGAVYMFSKMHAHLKYRKSSNTELRNHIKEVSAEAISALNRIASNEYNNRELVIYLRQLKYVVNQLITRLDIWLATSPKQGELPTAVQQSLQKLRKTEKNIQSKINSKKIALSVLQTVFKTCLSEVTSNTDSLDKQAKGQSNTFVRTVIFDTLGIVALYKTEFDILSRKNA